jgi:PKD repeat protein
MNEPPQAVLQIDQWDSSYCEYVCFIMYNSDDPDDCDDITLYELDFESDGTYDYSSSSDSDECHYYPAVSETYDVTLRVTSSSGQTATDTQSVTIVNNLPVADFDVNPPFENSWCEDFYFDASDSEDPDWCEEIQYFEWDFDGDGTYDTIPSTDDYVYHGYPAVDTTYDVTLRVTSQSGQTDTYTDTVTVHNSNAEADFDIYRDDPYWCSEIEFDGGWSEDDDFCDTIILYEWDFDGDGIYDDSDTSYTAFHYYADPGTYNVKLRVTSSDATTDTEIRTLNLENAPPVADFDYWQIGVDEMRFNAEDPYSYDPGFCEDLTYSWDFGDGTTGTGVTVDHTYPASGDYDVTLTVTEVDHGQTDSRTRTVSVET